MQSKSIHFSGLCSVSSLLTMKGDVKALERSNSNSKTIYIGALKKVILLCKSRLCVWQAATPRRSYCLAMNSKCWRRSQTRDGEQVEEVVRARKKIYSADKWSIATRYYDTAILCITVIISRFTVPCQIHWDLIVKRAVLIPKMLTLATSNLLSATANTQTCINSKHSSTL